MQKTFHEFFELVSYITNHITLFFNYVYGCSIKINFFYISADPEADADDDDGHKDDNDKDCNKNEEKLNENNFNHQNSLNDGSHSPEPQNGEIPLPLWWPQLEHRK